MAGNTGAKADKKLILECAKKIKLFNPKDEGERVKLRRAILRMCYEKNRDPEDVDPYLGYFLSRKTEAEWLKYLVALTYVEGDNNEIATASWIRAKNEKKEPFIVPYIPLIGDEVRRVIEQTPQDKLENLKFTIKSEKAFEGMFFKLEEPVNNARPLSSLEAVYLTLVGFLVGYNYNKHIFTKTSLLYGIATFSTINENERMKVLRQYMLEAIGLGYFEDKEYADLMYRNITNGLEFGADDFILQLLARKQFIEGSLIMKYSHIFDKSVLPMPVIAQKAGYFLLGTHAAFLNTIFAYDLKNEYNIENILK
ncbi:MAG: hypothetical protein QXP22_02865 [Candidatus Anstonellales archaeon]